MKEHSNNFETEIKTYGRQQAVQVIFEQDGQEVVLDNENVFSATPNFKASLLKSAMKGLILDCNVEIPVGTRLQFKYGILVNNAYEYLDFGYYIVNKIEKKEDARSYEITCYDKMMLAMVDYIDIGIEYPITIRNYINSICNHLEIDFGSNQDQFINYDKEIPSELYLDANGNSLGYTFRDVLDELSQATASVICIDENDQLVVRYPTETNKIIDEDYLKNINVNFGEKYGPINSLVIARAADSDFIYKEDEQSIAENGLCEVKISDNQILNDDNRVQFIDAIFNQLRGTEFYLNDFSSTGITYLDLLDYYEVKVFDNLYKCLMLNDELDITQGLQEQIFTERLKESETEYKSISKQDQSILRTGIKVNKVEGEIQSVVEQIGDRSQKTTTITQDIDGIEEIVQDYQDLTETKYAIGTINFENVNRSVPIYVKIHPTYTDIVGVVPTTRLHPSNSLYPDEKYKALHFYNVTEDKDIIYRLPCNLYYLNSNVYDEFIIDFDKKKCYVIQRVQVTNGIKTALQEEQIIYFNYPDIALTDGDYSIYVINDSYVEVKLMKQNDFTKQFATEVELQSSITMTNRAIQLEVEQRQKADENLEDDITAKLELKVDIDDNDQVVSMINASADVITLNSNRLIINSSNFVLDAEGNITATGGDIGGFSLSNNNFSNEISGIYDYDEFDIITINSIMYGNVNATSEQMRILDYNNDNVINILDRAKIKQVVNGQIESEKTINGNVYINSNNPKNCIEITDDGGSTQVSIGLDGVNTQTLAVQQIFCSQVEGADATNPLILLDGQNGVIKLAQQSGSMDLAGEYVYIDYESIEAPKLQSTNALAESTTLEGPTLTCTNSANQTTTINGGDITCVSLTQTSKAEEKKDFEKYQGALKEFENIDIYKYRMKNEEGKKHIGFVIGDNFKYSKEVTNQNNDGVDVYSFVSLCCQAIKELQEEIKELKGENV